MAVVDEFVRLVRSVMLREEEMREEEQGAHGQGEGFSLCDGGRISVLERVGGTLWPWVWMDGLVPRC